MRIEKIYVINLDREKERWSKIEHELRHVLDASGIELLNRTARESAIDAMGFAEDPPADAEVDPIYSLRDQLFVEPQPLTLPTKFELDAPIRMSRAEIAVARSHINLWRKISKGDQAYSLILEDDVWFSAGFAQSMDRVWTELFGDLEGGSGFDVLYVSYLESKHGAPKALLTENIFQPTRGLWHLCGYVLSKEGAGKLLNLLPCRGPVDLWINHQFDKLKVRASRRVLISQRSDAVSSNSYSILPALTTIGAITSEGAALFNVRPVSQPVFVFGTRGSGHSSVAMALSMLGYRCCSDLEDLPKPEISRLINGFTDRVFDAYVNIGSLRSHIRDLQMRYPTAKFILTKDRGIDADDEFAHLMDELSDADVKVLYLDEPNKWQVICEHLRCAPPPCVFPVQRDLSQRRLLVPVRQVSVPATEKLRRDPSPWVIEARSWWQGIQIASEDHDLGHRNSQLSEAFDCHDSDRWHLRTDTFTDNLALFRPENIEFAPQTGATLSVKNERLGVRAFSAAAITSRHQYLFGRFEASIRASSVPGIVTGFFLHRNSPRQEIDIEIAGNRPDRLVTNVFYNPGADGAKFDYGYRGAPCCIDLGFDASKAIHRYAIEWNEREISWYVDGKLVHKRSMWDPTPIPHLPMALHFNIWPTRSSQLAGRLAEYRLPATALISQIAVSADSAE